MDFGELISECFSTLTVNKMRTGLAILGIVIAYYKPATKFPHSLHVLLSTWASLFHILMAKIGALSWALYVTIFIFLFLAVWLPCCVSDIVFPLLFIKEDKKEKI